MKKFPEVAKYHKGKGSIWFLGYCTPIDDLISQLGEPDEKNTKWRYYQAPFGLVGFAFSPFAGLATTATVFTIRPVPPQEYIWKKGNYRIVALVDTSINC